MRLYLLTDPQGICISAAQVARSGSDLAYDRLSAPQPQSNLESYHIMSELLSHSLFFEIAALLVLAASIGFIGHLLRQPLIVSFIAVGILAGPSVLDMTQSSEKIAVLSELGIALLLFLVGLKLDVKLVRSLGAVSLSTGLGQVAFTAGVGFLLCLGLGYDPVASLYIAVALTFSSTIIIVKLLSDKREVDSLHGQIALGFLIVQDIVVVLAMIVLSAIGIGTDECIRVAGCEQRLCSRRRHARRCYAFHPFRSHATYRYWHAGQNFCCSSQSLKLPRSQHWDDYLSVFGKELGGLLAGISLASTPYRRGYCRPSGASLRDFLLLFFFIALGSKLQLEHIGAATFAATILSLFVLIGNPLIVMAIMGAWDTAREPAFLLV